jgi:adenylate kinase
MAIKARLSQNDCRNRGFILDNFPKHYEECDLIFFPNKRKLKRKKKPKKKEIKKKVEEIAQEERTIA